MTTIKISDLTKQHLQMLKKKSRAHSYDEVLRKLTTKELGGPKSMFGSVKGIGPWTKADKTVSKYD